MKKNRALRAPNGGCNPFEKGPQGPKLTVLAYVIGTRAAFWRTHARSFGLPP